MNKKYRISIRGLIVAIFLLIVFAGGEIVKQRAFSYGYNQQQDYRYSFTTGNSTIIETKLENNQLDLSGLHCGYGTVFVELGIQATLSSFWKEPEVKMIAGSDTLFQNFECRAKGIRYLNISGLSSEKSQRIHLSFSGCKPVGQSVKLIACPYPELQKERILILAPHPDDAEISAYGLYASYPENTFIATITAGDAGSMRYDELYSDSVQHFIQKGKVRVWNSLTVPQLGGIAPEHAINLGYFDASLAQMHADTTAHGFSRYIKTDDIHLFRSANCPDLPGSLQPSSTWCSLVNDMKNLLKKVQPTAIVTVYPVLDYHLDHKFTTVAMLQAMQEMKYDQCQLWLYTNHYPMTKMYPDGKIGSTITVPPYFENAPIYFDQLLSVPLSKAQQGDKALALDAMNDLRPDTQYRNTKASWEQTKQNFWDKLYLKESDYFRRSVRSNELFFVIEGKNALQPDIQSKILREL
ncbi:PIG-L deacetylase family protein [Roseimarinus sediminis]|uniref:PIG-L deacetylase family protein n=1 Tax=Roseimarinus sediminis TaxID=1610899 RepID=UPI003D2618CF